MNYGFCNIIFRISVITHPFFQGLTAEFIYFHVGKSRVSEFVESLG